MGEDRKRIEKYIRACKNGEAFLDDFYFCTSKGNYKWVRVAGQPVVDSVGKIIKLRGTFQDISDLKQKTISLHTLISSIDDIIFEIDKNSVCLNVWARSDEKLFFPREQVIGANFLQIMPEPILSLFKSSLEEVLSTRKTTSMHEYCDPFAPDPSKANWFRCKIAPQVDGSREIERLTMVITDITNEVHSRQGELQKQHELEQIMNAINNCAIVASTDRDGKILEVNDNFTKLTKYTRDELIGSNQLMLNSSFHTGYYIENMWKPILNGEVWTGEITNINKDGQQYIVQSVVSPLTNSNGEIDRYLSIQFDVSQVREYQRLLEEAQRVAMIGSWSYEAWSKRCKWSKQMYEIFGLTEKKLRTNL